MGMVANGQHNGPQSQGDVPPEKPSPGDIAVLVTFFLLILGVVCWKYFNQQFPLYSLIAALISGLFLVYWQIAKKKSSLLLHWLKGGYKKLVKLKKDSKQDIYISYDSSDVIWKDWIAYTLEQAGYTVIPESLMDGGFIDHMHDGDKIAKYKMIIWSPSYLNKLGNDFKHQKELTQQKHGHKKCLQVVTSRRSEFNGMRVINLTELDETAASKYLLECVRKRLGQRSVSDTNSGVKPPLFPGSSWNVPNYNGSNPIFKDEYQDDTLSKLYEVLIGTNRQDRFTKPQALTGLANMGKTEIAMLYAYQNRNHYKYVFWIEALNRDSVVEGFKHIARVVKPGSSNGQEMQIFDSEGSLCITEEQLIELTKQWLEETRYVLLILDRCDNLDDGEIEKLLPRQARSHILLTTCSPKSESIAETIEIKGLRAKDGANLLLKLAGKRKEDGDYSKIFHDVQQLSERVGGIPSALIAMGKYIKATGCTIQDFVKIFGAVQGHQNILDAGNLTTRWSSQLQNVQQANYNASHLLLFCAFLNSSSIPVELISQGASVTVPTLAFLEDITMLNEAIKNLRHYSLIERHEEKILRHDGSELSVDLLSINPMLQLWLKEFKLTSYRDRSTLAEQVVKAVARTFPDVTDTLARIYACHDEQCYELITQYKMTFSEAIELLDKLGKYFTEVDINIDKAQKYLNEAINIRKKVGQSIVVRP